MNLNQGIPMKTLKEVYNPLFWKMFFKYVEPGYSSENILFRHMDRQNRLSQQGVLLKGDKPKYFHENFKVLMYENQFRMVYIAKGNQRGMYGYCFGNGRRRKGSLPRDLYAHVALADGGMVKVKLYNLYGRNDEDWQK